MSTESKTPAPEPPSFEERHADAIREKVAAGLTRDQASQVVRTQIAHDKYLEDLEKKSAKTASKRE